MFELNKVFVAGNLTRDPELKYLPSGMAVADLGLAVNRRMFDRASGERKEETIFLDVTVWDKSAEFCKNYLRKGSAVIVEGRLKMDTWQDKQTGANRSKIGVVAERIQFADSKGASGGEGGNGQPEYAERGGGYQQQQAPQQQRSSGPSAPQAPQPGNTEDDLPF